MRLPARPKFDLTDEFDYCEISGCGNPRIFRRSRYGMSNLICSTHHDHRVRYKLSIDNYLLLMNEKSHNCAICGVYIDDKKMVIDHDHITGEVRGILCGSCNSMIGFAYDNPDTLQNAISYLGEYNWQVAHSA